jgi:prepilin-type N-terminal cleavage/methylation domain-containing protein
MNITQHKVLPAGSIGTRLFKRSGPSGFTVIELLVVIVILCILAALVGLTYSGVQSKNRNAERQADIEMLKGQLETYYAQTNTYPQLGELSDASWRSAHMKKLNDKTVQDPRWNNMVGGCTTGGKVSVANEPKANCYSYQVTGSDGSACNNVTVVCAHYTLTALLEGGEKYVKSSFN